MFKKIVIFLFITLFLIINLRCSNKKLDGSDSNLTAAAMFIALFNVVDNGIVYPNASVDFLNTTKPSTLTNTPGSAVNNITPTITITSPNQGTLAYTSTIYFDSGAYGSAYATAISEKKLTQAKNHVNFSNLVYNATYKGASYKISGSGIYDSTVTSTGMYLDSSGLQVPNSRVFTLLSTGTIVLTYNNVNYTGSFNVDTSLANGGTITVNSVTFNYKNVIDYINSNGGSMIY